MKNFNRCNSHGHHGSKHRELAQHAHSRGSQAFTHTLDINTVTTTVVQSASSAITEFGIHFLFSSYPKEGGANRSSRRKTQTAYPLISITY